ncbi:rhombosortase [Gallaecimonas pentaromativorans]|uniref:rhombosortase n=1 Tax=Gallaecimonas pentaromativorans TaxID=584787 RepID=UPI00067EFD3E|nr:rhombosortase [Gallaecimonas pentaromativorans]MED5525531.1 rhombosortase [Pseudomonadota bacterium]
MPHLVGAFSLILLASLLMLLPADLHQQLMYQRQAILDGQLWRLVTGHLLHTNGWHLAMNSAGTLVIAWLHGRYYRFWGWWGRLGYLSVASSLGLLAFCPALQWYVGLSGILHGLLLMGALEDIRRGEKTGWLIIIGVIAKIGWEQWHGAAAETIALIGAPVATDAHLFGALAVLPWWLVSIVWRKRKGA